MDQNTNQQQRQYRSTLSLFNEVNSKGTTNVLGFFEASVSLDKVTFTQTSTTDRNGQPRQGLRANFTAVISGRADYLARYGLNAPANQEGRNFVRMTVWDYDAHKLQNALNASSTKRLSVTLVAVLTMDSWTGQDGQQRLGISGSARAITIGRELPPAQQQSQGQGGYNAAPAHGGWANQGGNAPAPAAPASYGNNGGYGAAPAPSAAPSGGTASAFEALDDGDDGDPFADLDEEPPF